MFSFFKKIHSPCLDGKKERTHFERDTHRACSLVEENNPKSEFVRGGKKTKDENRCNISSLEKKTHRMVRINSVVSPDVQFYVCL